LVGLALVGFTAFTPPPDTPDDTDSRTVSFHTIDTGELITCKVNGSTGAYDQPSGIRIEGSTLVTGDAGCRDAVAGAFVRVSYDDSAATSTTHSSWSANVSVSTHAGAKLGATTHGASFFCSTDEGTICDPQFTTQPK
jgi:hypothetical protein